MVSPLNLMRSLDQTCSYGIRNAVSLIKQLPIWKGLLYPLNTCGCAKWIQLLWFPFHRQLLGWKHFFIIAFNSMLGVPTVPLLRLRLSWRSFSTIVIGAFAHLEVISLIRLQGRKKTHNLLSWIPVIFNIPIDNSHEHSFIKVVFHSISFSPSEA